VITVSSIIPPCSLRSTDNVDVYGTRVESDEGVNHSRNWVAVGPRKLERVFGLFNREGTNKDSRQRLLGLYHVPDVEEPCTLSHMLVARNCSVEMSKTAEEFGSVENDAPWPTSPYTRGI